ncbi:MAG: hypothetical protein PVSMB8_16520 [Vulcanimicrobiaceae bacterium]
MANFNHITVVGNLTRDPEIRYVDDGGKAVTKFTIAINRKTKAVNETIYLDIIAWERLGEICNQYLKKGMPVLVDGRLAIRDYVNKDGEKRRAVEIVAREMQMLGSKSSSEAHSSPPSIDGFGDDGDDGDVPF